MNKFTPGPWLHRGKSDSVHTACETHPYGPYLFSFKEESAPTDGDLALILAAPESHEANQMFVRAINEMQRITADHGDDRIYDEMPSGQLAVAYFAARAAIAKATGEVQ